MAEALGLVLIYLRDRLRSRAELQTEMGSASPEESPSNLN
jgi:hypothetical protein